MQQLLKSCNLLRESGDIAVTSLKLVIMVVASSSSSFMEDVS